MRDITAFKEKLFAAAKAKGFADWELYMSGSDSFSVRVHNGEIQEYKNAGDSGIGFRGTINGKMGYAFSEKVGDDVITFLIDNAAENAGIVQDPDLEELYPGDPVYPDVKTYSEALDAVPATNKVDKAITMNKTAAAADARVAGVDYCQVASGKGQVYIANSKGLNVSRSSNYASAFVSARVTENGHVKSDGERWVGYDWNDFDPVKTGEKAVANAVAMLGASPVPSGVYNVVFDHYAASDLLRTFWTLFSAERVQKGFSLLKGKLGQQIAGGNVTIRDDALIPMSPGSRPFDEEGVAAFDKAVVENGVLKTFLHNTKTAKKDGVKPTGNGSKNSYKSPLDIRPNNLYITGTDTSRADLLKEMNNGLLIMDLEGLHSGANPVSGDFSLSASGFLVENGVIVRPVEQITVAGNFLEFLQNIVKTADDLNLAANYGIASPSVWVKGINISGS